MSLVDHGKFVFCVKFLTENTREIEYMGADPYQTGVSNEGAMNK